MSKLWFKKKMKRKLLHAMAQRKLQNSKEAAVGSKDLRDNIALYLGWAGNNPKIPQGFKKITEDN